MRGVVCVPFRPAPDPHRLAVWEFLRVYWERSGLPVSVADCDAERFSVARARNLAAEQAGAWDAALFVDADILIPARQAHAALARAAEGRYVTAYKTLHWLPKRETARVLDGEAPTPGLAGESVGGCWLNAFAIGRALWDELEGFDSDRFPGIGGEDVSFFDRAKHLRPPSRVPGHAYHLWHEPRESRWT